MSGWQKISLDSKPSLDVYLSEEPGGYIQVAEWLRRKYIERRKEEGPWDHLPSTTRRNCIVALIKAQQFHIAEDLCCLYLDKAQKDSAGFSPAFWGLYCLKAMCLILGKNPSRFVEAEMMYQHIEARPAHRAEIPVYQNLQELRWAYYRRQDHSVLHGHDDGLQNLVPVFDMASVPLGPRACIRASTGTTSERSSPSTPQSKWRGLIRSRRKVCSDDSHPYIHNSSRRQVVSPDIQGLSKNCLCPWTSNPCIHEGDSSSGTQSPGGQTSSKMWQYFSQTDPTTYSATNSEAHNTMVDIGLKSENRCYDTTEPWLAGDEVSQSWSALPRPGDDLPAHTF